MQRWEPDDQLVPAVLARIRPYAMSDLTAPDRCWVVAGLTLHGLTAEDIAERLSCSLRLVRSLRAEPMTTVCMWAQREADVFSDELRLSRSEHKQVRLAHAAAVLEATRLRGQIARIVASQSSQTCVRGHDISSPYARYERNGRSWCRECHRERQATYRARQRVHSAVLDSTP
jgi:hypothetical protein